MLVYFTHFKRHERAVIKICNLTARSCKRVGIFKKKRKIEIKVQFTYDYTNADVERKGYDEMDYIGSVSEDNFEEDIANLVVAWLKHQGRHDS